MNGVNPDADVNEGTTTVDAAAYTSNRQNATATTLYTLDSASNKLFIQSPANSGKQTNGLAVTLNGAPLDFSEADGFDIDGAVDAPAADAAVTTGSGYAFFIVS